jgi:hypothetical protein
VLNLGVVTSGADVVVEELSLELSLLNLVWVEELELTDSVVLISSYARSFANKESTICLCCSAIFFASAAWGVWL